jgi:hypothetical protein
VVVGAAGFLCGDISLGGSRVSRCSALRWTGSEGEGSNPDDDEELRAELERLGLDFELGLLCASGPSHRRRGPERGARLRTRPACDEIKGCKAELGERAMPFF